MAVRQEKENRSGSDIFVALILGGFGVLLLVIVLGVQLLDEGGHFRSGLPMVPNEVGLPHVLPVSSGSTRSSRSSPARRR